MPAGTTRSVQGGTRRDGLQDGPHDGLLDLDQRIAGVVVSLRPTGVAAGSVDDWHIETQLVDSLVATNDPADLIKSCQRHRVVFEEMTHGSHPLDTYQELAETKMPSHPPRMPDGSSRGTPILTAPCPALVDIWSSRVARTYWGRWAVPEGLVPPIGW